MSFSLYSIARRSDLHALVQTFESRQQDILPNHQSSTCYGFKLLLSAGRPVVQMHCIPMQLL